MDQSRAHRGEGGAVNKTLRVASVAGEQFGTDALHPLLLSGCSIPPPVFLMMSVATFQCSLSEQQQVWVSVLLGSGINEVCN